VVPISSKSSGCIRCGEQLNSFAQKAEEFTSLSCAVAWM
jgi:hypothetical protein